jgi:hypothetical protein
MTKTITIPDNLAGDLQVYAKNCIPEISIDEAAVETLKIGIDYMSLQLRATAFLKQNPGTT